MEYTLDHNEKYEFSHDIISRYRIGKPVVLILYQSQINEIQIKLEGVLYFHVYFVSLFEYLLFVWLCYFLNVESQREVMQM